MKDLIIRNAQSSDMNDVLEMIVELAEYEKAGDQVKITLSSLIKDGFGKQKRFEVIVAEFNKKICGYAFYYNSYSTWKGRALYLEDLMVRKEYRRKGIGEQLLNKVIEVAIQKKAKRIDWQILKWNHPAIDFYKKKHTTFSDEWINGRLFELDLKNFSKF